MRDYSPLSVGFHPSVLSAVDFLSDRRRMRLLACLADADVLSLEEIRLAMPAISDVSLMILLHDLTEQDCVTRIRRIADLKTAYAATEKARRLVAILRELEAWSREYEKDGESPCSC